MRDDIEFSLTDLADGTLVGPEWDAWLAGHPEAAAEVEIARRVRAIVAELQSALIIAPPDFEARLMEMVRGNATILDLFELALAGVGRALLELLEALFGILPAAEPSVGA